MDLFAEILPINLKALPTFTLYKINTISSESPDKMGGKLSYQLQKKFSGHWHWDQTNQSLITDSPQSEDDLNSFVQELWQRKDEIFKKSLESIALCNNIQPSSQGIANFVAQGLLADVAPKIRHILAKSKQNKGKYDICLECERYGCVVNGHPSVSLSLKSRLDYKGTVKIYVATLSNPQELIGLHVTDITKPDFQSSMEITSIVGKLGENNTRQRLLSYSPPQKMIDLITKADDQELVIEVAKKYSYVVSALQIRIYNEDYDRLNISERLQITSDKRIEYLKPITQILKKTGFVGNAYTSTRNQNLFLNQKHINYSSQLLFGNGNKAHKNVFNSVKNFGAYKPSSTKQIRIAILNTVPTLKLIQFRNNIRRNLGKEGLNYDLKLTGEEVITQLSRVNLEKAIDKLKEKSPDIILAIIDGKFDDENQEWTLYDHFKNLTLKNNIYSQVVRPKTIGNQFALKNILLGILAKTGTIPYILAQPIEYADLIVGLDVSRQKNAPYQVLEVQRRWQEFILTTENYCDIVSVMRCWTEKSFLIIFFKIYFLLKNFLGKK